MSIIENTKIDPLRNPYPGIRSFDVNEGQLFFGRKKQIKELNQILTKTHFIAISGSSGSGKSSLIKGGLIPSLITSKEEWLYMVCRPGNNPLKNFTDELISTLKSDTKEKKNTGIIRDIEKELRDKKELSKILQEINFQKKILLYIDQFEELFRYSKDESLIDSSERAEIFVKILVDSVKQSKIPIYVIISLRSDFLSDCTDFSGLPGLINEGHYLIPRMTYEDKMEVITGPALAYGTKVSEELVEILREDIENNNIGLPVLQHALMRTWDYWLVNAEPGVPILPEHYKAVGTVKDALSIHAEVIYESLKTNENKKITEKVFKTLTHLGDDNRGIRRPTALSSIATITNSRPDDVINVINKFRADGNNFLAPQENISLNISSIVDISHESIMRGWKRLVEWVDEETKSAQLYLRLSKSAELYQEGKTGLLVNPDLQLALKWVEENNPNEEWALRYDPAFARVISYINYSKNEYEKSVRAKEERQKRGLKRARIVALFLGTASLISILFMIVALSLQSKAKDSENIAKEKEKVAVREHKISKVKEKEAVSHKRIAEQQQLIAIQQRLLAEEQKQYAVEQQKEAIYQKKLAYIAKNDAEDARDIARKLQASAEILRDQAIQKEKEAKEQKKRAEISEARTDTLRRLAISKSLAVQAVDVNRNNQKTKNLSKEQQNLPSILALQSYYFNKNFGGDSNNADVFTALSEVSGSKEIIRGKITHQDAIRCMAVSNDGNSLISGGDDGKVFLYQFSDITKSTELKTAGKGKKGIRSLNFSPANNIAVGGTYDGEILVWKSGISENPVVLIGHTSIVNQIIFVGKEDKFVSISNDGSVRLWDINNTSLPSKVIYTTTENIISITKNEDGSKFAFCSSTGKINIFDSQTLSEIKKIEVKGSEISCITWNKFGDIDVGFKSGKIQLRKSGIVRKEFFAHSSGINSIIYDKKNNSLISCSYDGSIKIWDYSDPDVEPVKITDHKSWVYSIIIDEKDRKLISTGADKSIRITSIDIEDIKNIVRKKVTVNMSKKDWLRYVGEGIEYSGNLPE